MAEQVKLNMAGVQAVLKACQPQLDAIGRQMAAAAGDGFEYEAKPHRYTARGYVQTASARGRRREAIEKVLIKTLGSV